MAHKPMTIEKTDPRATDRVVTIVYTNYRGETSERRIIPERIWYGATDWHPEEQWLLEAFDVGRSARRSFALLDIHRWESHTAPDVRE